MAFADPQEVTINAVPHSLPRVGFGPTSGVFSTPDGEQKLTISHAVSKRARRTARLDHKTVVTDPLSPALNTPRSMSVYLVVDAPLNGYSSGDLTAIAGGLLTWLGDDSAANLVRLLGGEN
jgi:hypothetical protein